MVLSEPTVTLPTTSVTGLIAWSLQFVNSSVSGLPISELLTVVSQLQQTNAIVGHVVRRANLARTHIAPLESLDRDAQELSELADYLESMSTNDHEAAKNNCPNVAATVIPTITPDVVQHVSPAVPANAVLTAAVISIPAAYLNPPVLACEEWPSGWYVITRGRCVGIFTDWEVAGTYVIGVPGALHKMHRTWPKARAAYNNALASGVVKLIT